MGTVSGAPKKEMGYEEIFTYRHLYESYKRCLKGKRGKKEALDFSLNASKNLMFLFFYRKNHMLTQKRFVGRMVRGPEHLSLPKESPLPDEGY